MKMNKYEKRSKRSYDKKAENYETTYDGKFTVKFNDMLCEAVEIAENATVVDVGCGNGRLLRKLKEKASFRGCGVDMSEKMIECAKKESPDAEFFVAPCNALPFGDSCADAVIVCAAFHHFPKPDDFAKEAARILKIGGKLYIADVNLCAFFRAIVNPFIKFSPAGDVKIYSPKQIVKLFGGYGFSVVDIKIDGKVQLITLQK